MSAPAATYEYADAAGRAVYEVVRYDDPDKRFVQRRPDGKGGWAYDLDGTERTPYRLHEVIDRTERGGDVVVVEGEKDADTLVSHGIVATTNSGGAAWRWPDEWAEHFRGARTVYVIADNDEPGRKAARQRAGVIAQAVADVRVVDALPDVGAGGDVTDYLAGHSLDDLWRTLETAPNVRPEVETVPDARPLQVMGRTVTAVDPATVDLGRIDLAPIVRGETPDLEPGVVYRDDGIGLYYPGCVHDLHGEPGHGKSWFLAFTCAEELRNGGAVIVLDYEATAAGWVKRLRALGVEDRTLCDDDKIAYHNLPGEITEEQIGALTTEAYQIGVTFIVLDAMLPALARNGRDDNANTDVAWFYNALVWPLVAQGAAVAIADHVARDAATRTRGARGAGAKLQLADVSYAMKMTRAGSTSKAGRYKLTCAKDRNGTYAIGDTVANVVITPEDDARSVTVDVYAPATDERSDDRGNAFRPTGIMEAVSKALEANPAGLSTRAIKAAVRGGDEYKYLAVELLVNEGYVRVESGPRNAQIHQSAKPFRDTNP